MGSPPHTREQLANTDDGDIRIRITPAYAGTAASWRPAIQKMSMGITPAYAGTAFFSSCDVFFCKDHPRIRGNSVRGEGFHRGARGSPPHTREQPISSISPNPATRITPAYAGTAQTMLSSRQYKQDHPRIRGNSRLRHRNPCAGLGSPPHTREQPHEF